MKVQINNLKKGLISGNDNIREAKQVFIDPDCRYAVAEIFSKELFVALKITDYREDEDYLCGDYVNYYSRHNDVPMLMRFSVDWECIKYGFCKLNLFAPELSGEFGGYLDGTVARFYFDWDIYKKSYEELNGVPCNKKNPNEV